MGGIYDELESEVEEEVVFEDPVSDDEDGEEVELINQCEDTTKLYRRLGE